MPRFEVTAPDGKKYRITAPEGANKDQALEYFKQQYSNKSVLNGKNQEAMPKQIVAKTPETGGIGQFLQGATFGLGDEAIAATVGLRSGIDKGGLFDKQAYDQALGLQRQAEKEFAAKNQAVSLGLNLLGAVAVPIGAVRGGVGLASKIGRGIASGAATGAASGFGAGEGSLENRLSSAKTGAAIGATIGAAAPAVAGTIGGAKRALFGNRPSEEIARLSEVGPLSVGQAGGGSLAAIERGGLAKMPIAGKPLRDLQEKQVEAITKGIDDAVLGVPAASIEDAGEALQSGVKRALDRYQNTKSALYERAFRNIPQDAKIIPEKTLAALDAFDKKFAGNEAAKRLAGGNSFKEITDAINNKNGISVGLAKTTIKGRIRDMASAARTAGQNSLARDLEDVVRSIDEDIVNTAESIAPGSMAKIKSADAYMTARIKQNEKLAKLFESASPDKVTAARAYSRFLQAAAEGSTGDAKLLATVKKSIPKDEFNRARGFLVGNLGKTSANITKSWEKISPEAKSILFNPAERKALDKVMDYANAVDIRDLNPSGTAGQVAELGAVGALAMGGGTTALIGLTVPYIASYVLSNPKIAVKLNSLSKSAATKFIQDEVAPIAIQSVIRTQGNLQAEKKYPTITVNPSNQGG